MISAGFPGNDHSAAVMNAGTRKGREMAAIRRASGRIHQAKSSPSSRRAHHTTGTPYSSIIFHVSNMVK